MPIRKKSYPYKVKKFWGWKTKQKIELYNTRGTRITWVRYNGAGTDANRRVILTRFHGKKRVMVYIDSLGNTTPYDYPRR